jgi:CheY-like chemotaxis protein
MTSPEDEVMVIEDETEVRVHLVKLLELEGFKVIAYGNGAEALAALQRESTLSYRSRHSNARDGRSTISSRASSRFSIERHPSSSGDRI